MREDPRRRLTYGFTIEGVNMRVWYMNRSDVFVSWSFDINTVRGHLSLMLSDNDPDW